MLSENPKGKEEEFDPNKERTFLTGAYLLEMEPGTFGLYRHLEVQFLDPSDGKVKREKRGKPIGPLGLFRPALKGEEQRVKLRTVHPKTGNPIELVNMAEDK